MSKLHKMIISAQFGRSKEIAEYEIKSVVARDVAPQLATTIIAHDPFIIHSKNSLISWGQLPSERASTTVGGLMSTWINRLGGTIRLMTVYSNDGWEPVSLSTDSLLKAMICGLGPVVGKATVGLSSLTPLVNSARLRQLMGELKQEVKRQGFNARVVLPREGLELSAAAVKYNKLVEKGYEFVILPGKDKGKVWLGLTLAVYDPDRDAYLDRGIPVSDAKSGMLPPKIARMMVNIGVGTDKVTIVDPFCGNGRVLLEGALLGYKVSGGDIDQAKIEATKANLQWLQKEEPTMGPVGEIKVQDARSSLPTISEPHVVVTEPWLGPPLRQRPEEKRAQKYAQEVENLLVQAVPNLLKRQPKRVVMVVPTWRTTGRSVSVVGRVLDVFRSNGYDASCIATIARSDSFVAREILVADIHGA